VHEAVSPLAAWESFYVIVGSSAAALTGLQFVVMALVADSTMRRSTREIDAFATPTIVHFSVVLLVSSILSAPWPGLAGVRAILLACGAAGFIYILRVYQRARRVTAYQPVLEDWMFHVLLPAVAYAIVLVGAALLVGRPVAALFLIGASALLLLVIGIHNAWDTVTYIALGQQEQSSGRGPQTTATEAKKAAVD
jgi:hypothetical protein